MMPCGPDDRQILKMQILRYTSKDLDAPNEALFPFGFGMSYAQFDYEQLTLSHRDCGHGDITATVKVSNTSKVEGDEIIEWYIQDRGGEGVASSQTVKRV